MSQKLMTSAEARRVSGSRLSLHLPSHLFFFCILWEIMAATRLLRALSVSFRPQREALGSASALTTRLSDEKTIFLTQ